MGGATMNQSIEAAKTLDCGGDGVKAIFFLRYITADCELAVGRTKSVHHFFKLWIEGGNFGAAFQQKFRTG